MKSALRLLSGIALALPLATAQAFDLEHSTGTLHLETPPSRVVSYDLGVLDSLDALGIPVVGVPRSTYQGHLEKHNQTPVIGTLFEPDYDTLQRLQPDLIFAGRRSQQAMPQLQDIAPTVIYPTHVQGFLQGLRDDTLALARAFDHEDQAAQAIQAIEHNVQTLQQRNQGKTGAFLFIMNDRIMAHAPGDRFGYAYELTGLESVLPAKASDQDVSASRPEPGTPEFQTMQAERARVIEQVAQANPDWLIILDRGAINQGEKTAARTLAAHPELSQTRAFQSNQVYYADPNGWYVVTGGLNNLKDITEDLLSRMK